MLDLGVGKSTLALQIAQNIAENGIPVCFISLEMSANQVIQKMLSRRSKINSNNIRKGELTDVQIDKISRTVADIIGIPFTILTKATSIQKIELEVKKLKKQGRLSLLVVDYLQLIKNKGKFNNREQEVADISRTLKLLSLELEIPIIALCQLNRNATRQKPTLADLRESGAIEQDADNVMFIYPKEENSERNGIEIEVLDLQKQRAGSTGQLELIFNKNISEFQNMIKRSF